MIMITDELLVYRARDGDLRAYEVLIQRYQDKVYNLAARMINNREDAHDLVQETFIQIYKSLRHFRGDCSFGTWLYRVATNKCLDFLRRKKPEQVFHPASEKDELIADSRDGPEESLLKEEEAYVVRKALASLPRNYRIVLVLHHYQLLGYKEIAEILDLPVKTVATRLYRARRILREKLTGGEYGEMQAGKNKHGQLPGGGISVI